MKKSFLALALALVCATGVFAFDFIGIGLGMLNDSQNISVTNTILGNDVTAEGKYNYESFALSICGFYGIVMLHTYEIFIYN